jgi:hypothetical protein
MRGVNGVATEMDWSLVFEVTISSSVSLATSRGMWPNCTSEGLNPALLSLYVQQH